MLDYLYHWVIHMFKENKESLMTFMLEYLFLLDSLFNIVYREVIAGIKC